ncbi:MAG: gliding motility protein GldL [Chitinophagaceae bacterium]
MAKYKKRTFLTVIDVLVSAGAAVIIFAAWAKLTHQSYADNMLTIGMWTETAIFFIYAVIEWVKPKHHEEDDDIAEVAIETNPLLSMDKMMQDAEINPSNLKKLGESFNKLQGTVAGISDVSDVLKSTADFGNKAKEATVAMGSMSTAFTASANSMASFNNASEAAKGFHEQVQGLTKNLGSLNTIYELELKEANNHLKSLNNFYGKLNEASATMMSSVEDATKAKEQIGSLANNLGKLNAVYGNMLNAMQGR